MRFVSCRQFYLHDDSGAAIPSKTPDSPAPGGETKDRHQSTPQAPTARAEAEKPRKTVEPRDADAGLPLASPPCTPRHSHSSAASRPHCRDPTEFPVSDNDAISVREETHNKRGRPGLGAPRVRAGSGLRGPASRRRTDPPGPLFTSRSETWNLKCSGPHCRPRGQGTGRRGQGSGVAPALAGPLPRPCRIVSPAARLGQPRRTGTLGPRPRIPAPGDPTTAILPTRRPAPGLPKGALTSPRKPQKCPTFLGGERRPRSVQSPLPGSPPKPAGPGERWGRRAAGPAAAEAEAPAPPPPAAATGTFVWRPLGLTRWGEGDDEKSSRTGVRAPVALPSRGLRPQTLCGSLQAKVQAVAVAEAG